MTEWSSFLYLQEVLITYWFGNETIYAITILLAAFVGFLMVGMDMRFAGAAMLPLAGAFAIAGFFGPSNWIFNLILIAIAAIYGYALIKVFT